LNTYGEWDLNPIDFTNILGKKTHLSNVEKPKIELKLQGWCVNANTFSYVSDPNMQCLEAK
jgi:hypothetical protein